MKYFAEGLFMTPAHTWKQMSAEYSVFDPLTEPACVGIIPNLFLKRPGVVRSLHSTHSIAAIGPKAGEYVKGEEFVNTPCAPGGCWDRLRMIHAKILLIGVTHARNTFIHSIEEVFDVPERFTEKPWEFQIKMPDGSLKKVEMYRHYNKHTAHISEELQMRRQYETNSNNKFVNQLKRNRKDTLDAVISEMCKRQRNGIWNRKLMENMLFFYQGTELEGKKKERIRVS